MEVSVDSGSEWMLVVAMALIGVFHTMVPDHWIPITLVSRQYRWSRGETGRFAALAGLGHVGTTLILGILVWIAGKAVAFRFGHALDTYASLGLIAFGGWFAINAWRNVRHSRSGDPHPHEPQDGEESDVSPHAPFCEQGEGTRLDRTASGEKIAPPNGQRNKMPSRMALLLLLGSSPMVEGIPIFFAAGKLGAGTVALLSAVFAISTIATYIVLCTVSSTTFKRVAFGPLERYGEVLSGLIIVLAGTVFWFLPLF